LIATRNVSDVSWCSHSRYLPSCFDGIPSIRSLRRSERRCSGASPANAVTADPGRQESRMFSERRRLAPASRGSRCGSRCSGASSSYCMLQHELSRHALCLNAE